MSTFLHRITLAFYNFSSILCLKYESQSFRIFKTSVLSNILKIPLSFIITAALAFVWPNELFSQNIFTLSEYSVFTQISVGISAVILQISFIVVNYLQIFNRFEILSLMNEALQLLEEKKLKKCRKAFAKNFLTLSLFFLAVIAIQFWSVMKPTLFCVAAFAVMMYPSLMMVAFVSFVKNFEEFLVVCLEDVGSDFNHLDSCNMKSSVIEEMKNYQKIFDLAESFNKCFGAQLTILVCCCTGSIVFQVLSAVIRLNLLILFEF